MKALFLTAPKTIEMGEAPEPEPGPGQAVVDLSHCGLCGSDMHPWHGHDTRRQLPIVLGHEAVGTARTGAHAGKRVAINPMETCGACPVCRAGNIHLCPERTLISVKRNGGFAEAVAIAESSLTPLPDTLDFETAALSEPLAVCVHAARIGFARHDGAPGDSAVVVLGGGAIGLLCALAFREMGVARVHLAEPNPLRRETVARVGAAEAYDPASGGPAPGSVDLVCDAVGSGRTRAAASELVRPGGTIVHVGLQDREPGLDTFRMTLQEITFVGTYCYVPADFAEALRLLSEGRVTREGWTEIRPLAEGAGAFRDVHDGVAPPKIILAV